MERYGAPHRVEEIVPPAGVRYFSVSCIRCI